MEAPGRQAGLSLAFDPLRSSSGEWEWVAAAADTGEMAANLRGNHISSLFVEVGLHMAP